MYELKTMTLGEILDNGFKVFSRNLIPLLMISLLVMVPYFALSFFVGMFALEVGGKGFTFVMFGVALIGLMLVQPIASAASTKLLADRYLGEQSSVGGSFAYALRILLPLLGALILSAILVFIGFILFVIPGIIIAIRLSLIAQACVVEGRGGTVAISRSRELTRGSVGKIFGIYLVIWAIGFFANLAIFSVWGQGIMANMVNYGVSIIIGAYASAVWVVTYFERRCDLEAFDLEMLAESLTE
jgi:hypothetical protein